MNSTAPFHTSDHVVTGNNPSNLNSGRAGGVHSSKFDTLKIVVVGTPKTGNTWVKHLLADVYSLPKVNFTPEFAAAEFAAAGTRWIAHQHFLPTHDLLTWGTGQQVVFVNVVRHPGDVLISLRHHMQNRRERSPAISEDPTQAESMLHDGPEAFREYTQRFVAQGFHFYLNLSIAWLGVPGVRAVRYEDLWTCPVEAFRALTQSILPVSDERLRLALCACELGRMQNLLDPGRKFLRQGGTGGWRKLLPAEIKAQFATLDPYPAQFAALGYTMDETDPVNAPQPVAGKVVGLFGPDCTFDDGTPVAPVLMKMYLELPGAQRDRWPEARSIAGDSFFNWLNRPAAADPAGGHTTPVISELAHYLHSLRSDLRAVFPDLFGRHRSAFFDWFIFNGRQEYGLARNFVAQNPFSDARQFSNGTRIARILVRAYLDLPEAMRWRWSDPAQAGEDSFLTWLNSPAAADPAGGALAPAVTELGAYLHSIRADVRAMLPDLYGAHRVDFSKWFFSSAAQEYELDRAFTLPVVRSWAESADRVPPHVQRLTRRQVRP